MPVLTSRVALLLGVIFTLVALVAGCSPSTPQTTSPISIPGATSPLPSPSPPISMPSPQVALGKGAITGVILDQDSTPFEGEVKVFLTPFYQHETDDWGIYVLDPNQATTVTLADSGVFQIVDIEPGDYVLVVGRTPETAALILGDDGPALVFKVETDEITGVGIQLLKLPE